MVFDNITSIATSALPLDPAIIITNTIQSIIGLVIAVLTGVGLLQNRTETTSAKNRVYKEMQRYQKVWIPY